MRQLSPEAEAAIDALVAAAPPLSPTQLAELGAILAPAQPSRTLSRRRTRAA